MGRALLATIGLVLAVLALCLVRYAPPAPVARDAPPERFSAQRARDVQEKIVSDTGASRTLGSEWNAKARKVLVDELKKTGFDTVTERSLSCSHHGACGLVENVIAKLEGTDPSLGAVLLSAHVDSVPVSPGASDDGLGASAAVEVARALGAGAKPKRTIVILLADGEEDGLLGAEAFVANHPLAKRVKLAVNVDSRGSTGPSAMFETSPGNAWLISLMREHVKRPVTTSLFYEVYKRMPNDTDFTSLKRIAYGLNFANLGDIQNYHTPEDSMRTTDPGTLQHHGDHALAALRALSAYEGDPAQASNGGDAVWFDLFAATIVSWPNGWALPLAILALVLVAASAWRYRAWDAGVFVGPVALAGGVIAAWAVAWAMRAMGAMTAPWLANPAPALGAVHLAAIAGGVAASVSLARRSTPRALWTGTWLSWSALGIASAIAAPGTSYVFVAPALAAGVAGAAPNIAVASSVPAIVAAIVVMPLHVALYAALGFAAPALVALPTALVVATFAPFWAGIPRVSTRVPLVALAACILAALLASVTAPFSTTMKQRVNVVFRQDDDREKARLFVDTTWGPSRWGEAPASMKNAVTANGSTSSTMAPAFPWTGPALVVDVPRIAAPPPELTVVTTSIESDRRKVRVHVKSKRGAPTVGVLLPATRNVSVDVCQKDGCAHAGPRFGVVAVRAIPKEGMDLELTALGGSDPIELQVFDRTYDLPKNTVAEAAAKARPPDATPFQDGDVTVIAKSFAP